MSVSLDDIPKKTQYIVVDSNFVNGSNNTFSLDLSLESNTHVEDLGRVLGIKMVDFYVTQIGAQDSGTPFIPTFKINGSGGNQEGHNAISLDGQRVVVGSPYSDTPASNAGKLIVYQRIENENWVQIGNEMYGLNSADRFGEFSLAINNTGSRVAGGSTRGDYVQVYEYDVVTSTWNIMGAPINYAQSGKYFGKVALNATGDILAVGISRDNQNSTNGRFHGAVQVYQWDGTTWNTRGAQLFGTAGVNEYFGLDVDLSGDGNRLVVGAPQNNNSQGSQAGAMKIYEWNNTDYVEMNGSPLLGTGVDDEGGYSVSISADGATAAMGIPFCNESGFENQGAVKVFRYLHSSSVWSQIGTTLEGEDAEDRFGNHVALNGNGNRLVVAAPEHNDLLGLNRGFVKVYDYNDLSDTWTLVKEKYSGELTDRIGRGSVDIDNDGNIITAGSIQTGGYVQIFEPGVLTTNIPKYIDIICEDVPKIAQMLDERHGQILARVPLERHFTQASTTILRDKQWRSFHRQTNYFNPISIQKLHFNIYEEQDDGDYLPLNPNSKFYMILEITTQNVKEKVKNRELEVLLAIEKLTEKILELNKNVERLPEPEKPKKKWSGKILIGIIVALVAVYIWYINRTIN